MGSGLLILKRDAHLLKITDIIYGGDRHASSIFHAEIQGNKIVFLQDATTYSLVAEALEHHPDLQPLYHKSSKQRLCYGEACFTGTFKYMASVTPEGKIENTTLADFTPCEGDQDTAETYLKGGLRAVALDLLELDIP